MVRLTTIFAPSISGVITILEKPGWNISWLLTMKTWRKSAGLRSMIGILRWCDVNRSHKLSGRTDLDSAEEHKGRRADRRGRVPGERTADLPRRPNRIVGAV